MPFNPDLGNNSSLFDFVLLHLAYWFRLAEPFPQMQIDPEVRLLERFIRHRADYQRRYYGDYHSLGVVFDPLPYPFRLDFVNDMLDAWGYPTQSFWTAEFFADYLNPPIENAWFAHVALPATVTLAEILAFPQYAITGMVILEMRRCSLVVELQDAYNVGSGGQGGRLG